MYTWNRFPFVRLAIAGISGIMLFEYFPEWWTKPHSLAFDLGLGFVVLWILVIFFKKQSANLYGGIVGLVLVIYLFGWVSSRHRPLETYNHWRHFEDKIVAFEGRVTEDVLEKRTTRRYSIELSKIQSKRKTVSVTGNLHLYVKKTGRPTYLYQDEVLKYGDVIRVLARPSRIPPPTNPEEFNYSAYMERQYVHGQSFVEEDVIEIIGHEPNFKVMALAYKVRDHFREKIKRYIHEEEQQAIALALLIGVKDYLSEDLKRAYASAGAMHVLAVSGLHVGILYLVLLIFLKPLNKGRYGKVLVASIAIAAIWLYTFVTGMSPSVLRAAVMFSVFATSNAMDRDNNIYNSLGIAAFILLLWDPNLLFSVGFQLSFLALTGIVYLQPKIYNKLYVGNKFLDKVWEITAVSIAAQISTLPLTIYYFHQFPTYFFLSNLVVIPGATVIMVLGISALVLGSIIDSLGIFLGLILSLIIQLMNHLVSWVEQIPGSLITWLYFDSVEVVLVYGALILFFLGWFHRSFSYFSASFLATIFVFLWSANRHWNQLQEEQLVFYDIADATAIDLINGQSAQLFLDSKAKANHELLRFQIDPFRRRKRLSSYEHGLEELKPISETKGALKYGQLSSQKVLLLDTLLSGYEISKPIHVDILVVNNHSVKSLDWLEKHFRFEHLIIGSNNSIYYSEWLKKELAARNVTAHSLLIDGSWQKKLSRSKPES